MHARHSRPSLPWILLGAAACGGGGGGSGGGSSLAKVDLLVGDAPSDRLSSFELTITGLFLERAGGSETENLLPSARTVNLLELSTKSALLEVTAAAPGSYDGARLAFDASSIVARDGFGARVPVAATASGALASLATPLLLVRGGTSRIRFELPLDDSLADDRAHPAALLFTPILRVADRRGEDEPLDEIHGRILSTDGVARRLRVELVEREGGAAHGELSVDLAPGAALLDDDGEPFPSETAFFAFARAQDRVEADGALLADGSFRADLVHVERDDGGTPAVARILGTIAGLDTAADRLTLRLRAIEFGRTAVEPVLASLGDPAEIEVEYSGAEIEVRGDDPRGGGEADLAIGQSVQVDSSAFSSPPFPAREIELEDERAEFEGTVVEDGALPSAFVVHLEPHDPAVLAGLVASAATDVEVLLDGSERVSLHLPREPEVGAARLLEGLRVRVRVDDPFGGAGLPDPVVLRLDPDATVEGGASTPSGLFELFGGLPPGASLDLEARGLSDGLGGAIAWEIDARVDD